MSKYRTYLSSGDQNQLKKLFRQWLSLQENRIYVEGPEPNDFNNHYAEIRIYGSIEENPARKRTKLVKKLLSICGDPVLIIGAQRHSAKKEWHKRVYTIRITTDAALQVLKGI